MSRRGASLSEAHQKSLNDAKTALRASNEEYLREHPELRALMSHFMSRLLEKKPKDVQAFAAEFFMADDLEEEVRELLGTVGFKV